jgi:hypothetical protein
MQGSARDEIHVNRGPEEQCLPEHPEARRHSGKM